MYRQEDEDEATVEMEFAIEENAEREEREQRERIQEDQMREMAQQEAEREQEREEETPEQAERRRALTRQMIEQINNAPAIAVNPDRPPRAEQIGNLETQVIRGDITIDRTTVGPAPEQIQFDPGRIVAAEPITHRITAGHIDTTQFQNAWTTNAPMQYIPPRRYEFDFKKVNSIQDIAKVLETLQRIMHVNINQTTMEEMGLKDLVKRVDDMQF